MLRYFENLIIPTAKETPGNPPEGILSFYWFFIRQAKGLFIMLLVASFLVAVTDAAIPIFMGRLVKALTTSAPELVVGNSQHLVFSLVILVLAVKPLVMAFQALVLNQAIAPGMTNLVRWQSH